MPEELPLMLNKVFGDISRGMSEMNASVSQSFMTGIKTFNEVAPHNLMAKMTAGSGQFNAKMTTQELNQKKIY